MRLALVAARHHEAFARFEYMLALVILAGSISDPNRTSQVDTTPPHNGLFSENGHIPSPSMFPAEYCIRRRPSTQTIGIPSCCGSHAHQS